MPASTNTLDVGSLVDCDQLELISLLGQGGFSKVFLAQSTTSIPQLYAVKCLFPSPLVKQPRSDPNILREASLHSLCSSHPSVVPLKKILFDSTLSTLLVMPYYPLGDLFTCILTHHIYLSRPSLIKSAALQILDAVEYCHSLGVFLRDIKPENILVDESGKKVYLTDFGLATTEEESEEFRTGSVFHMSPECHGPEPYFPRQHDIWSLGILILNLISSRNPWRRAHHSDRTFALYHDHQTQARSVTLSHETSSKKPLLEQVLPISPRISTLLSTRVLTIDPSRRISAGEFRDALESFNESLGEWYSRDVVFDLVNGCAKCKWEAEEEEAYCARVDSNDVAQDNGNDSDEADATTTRSPQSAWSSEESLPFISPFDADYEDRASDYSFHLESSPSSSTSSVSLKLPLPRPLRRMSQPAVVYASSLPKTPKDLGFPTLKVMDAEQELGSVPFPTWHGEELEPSSSPLPSPSAQQPGEKTRRLSLFGIRKIFSFSLGS